MSTSELKEKIISRLNLIDNDEFLLELYKILDPTVEKEVCYNLTEIQKDIIMEAEEDIETGKVKSNEEVENYFDKWLNE